MALSKAKMGEIALKVLLKEHIEEGFRLNPEEIKREITQGSKKYGISLKDSAEFVKAILKENYDETMAAIEAIKEGKRVKTKK